ncbi:hypothetical protein O6H91_19G053900 [Diphasiastrum complanatum]|uniref:Uncharacterized protein n=1 Tax=Diphasiastrum complanatum TaxID=34168 RepID=A0ACC2AV63_DIPCM|nr:hypothetical protein O6H91_Y549500 [Diphasiastrum complanatum]KAJ7521428.1 hypothetical protein O6H91_19G053900 [Diphasiastrum complanatum]
MQRKRASHYIPTSTMELERLYRLLVLAILVNVVRGRFLPGPWIYAAHATFYGAEDAVATMGGACGYGNLYQSGYGTETTALSSVLFNNGLGCGGCYQIRCVNSKYCYPGSPYITVTATNLCPANWARPTNNGGWCNPPREHFDMSKPAFMKIAFWRAGIVPVAYRRVPCVKQGGIHFNLQGNYWWLLVYITNVGGPGDISKVSVKGSRTGWIPMTRNWGAAFQVFHSFQGQSISFMITAASTRETVIAWNVAPPSWKQGAIYMGGQLG